MNLVRVKRRSATRSHLNAMFEHYRLASFVENTQDFEEVCDYYKNPHEFGTSQMKSTVAATCVTGVSFVLDLAINKLTRQLRWAIQGRYLPFGSQYDIRVNAGVLIYDGMLNSLPNGFQARLNLAIEFIEHYNAWLAGEGYALEVVLGDNEITIGPYIHMFDLVSELVMLHVPYNKFTDGLVKVNGRPPIVSLFKETLIEVAAKLPTHTTSEA